MVFEKILFGLQMFNFSLLFLTIIILTLCFVQHWFLRVKQVSGNNNHLKDLLKVCTEENIKKLHKKVGWKHCSERSEQQRKFTEITFF